MTSQPRKESPSPYYLLISYLVSSGTQCSVIDSEPAPQVQTFAFNENLVRALKIALDGRLGLVSSAPAASYPKSSIARFKRIERLDDPDDQSLPAVEMPFLNLPLLRLFSRFRSTLREGIVYVRKNPGCAGIIVYSVHLPYMLAGKVLSTICGLPMVGVWTDPPAVAPEGAGRLHLAIRKAEARVSAKVMGTVDAAIVLAEPLAADFAPGKPYIVVEGIVNPDELSPSNSVETGGGDAFRVGYTGSLSRRYGLQNVVEGFQEAALDNAELHLYGAGPYAQDLQEISERDSRIHVHGRVSREKALAVQSRMDLLINARDPRDEYVKYSFPSKTLEYMLSGTPVAMTMLPGIPAEYRDHIIEIQAPSRWAVASAIERAAGMSPEGRRELGAAARIFALGKSADRQGKRIWAFLSKI